MSQLDAFERAAYGRRPDRVELLLACLRAAAMGVLTESPPSTGSTLWSRLAAATAAVFGDPELSLSARDVERVLVFKSTLDNVFRASAFGSADFVLRAIADQTGGVEALPADDTARLLLQSLDSEHEMPLEALLDLPPSLAVQAVAALLSTKPVGTRAGQARRDRLAALGARLQPADIPPTLDSLVTLTRAWMICSYASIREKHAIKRVFNQTLRSFARKLGLDDAPPRARRPLANRPVMAVAAEVMNANHVQYRYFGQYLRQLRHRFELVLVTDTREADPQARALFDRTATFERTPNGAHLREAHRRLLEVQPDIVFWPSVGMSDWGPLLANLRLAPIQFTGLGHSASTFCETMDYYVCEEGYVADGDLIHETAILLPDESLVFERPPHYSPVIPEVRAAPAPLRIAIPSNVLKLNPGFLAMLASIRSEATRPLEFHVIPAARGLELDAITAVVRRELPGARVHPTMTYERYLQVLSACDVNLSPFPFAGLHSVVDSLRQGLPVVAMESTDLHGRTDSMLLRRVGMPEWLIALDEPTYRAAALRLIHDDGLRVALSRQALEIDVDSLLFGDASTPLRSEVADAVSWFYSGHEAVKSSGRRVWTLDDREKSGFSFQ